MKFKISFLIFLLATIISYSQEYNKNTDSLVSIIATPNPFNEYTDIKITLSESDSVTVKVFNCLGNIVATLQNKTFLQAGEYTYQLSGENLENGLYIVQVTGIYNNIGKNIKKDSTINVNEVNASKFDIYPNPAKDIIYLNFKNEGEKEISFINIMGENIYSTTIFNKKEKINISKLKKGIYIVNIKNNNNSFSKKLIVY